MYKITTLENQLRVITHEVKDRESVSLGFWVGVGGRYEEDRLKGAAHFLEHIVFKGSRKYSCEEIKNNIEGVGGSLNAFTSEEQTCFYAKIPAKHLEKTFDVLADMVLSPLIRKTDVGKEKTVIAEEIKMYHDLPQYYVLELLDGLLWPGHPLGKSLAGTIESVIGMSNADLKGFHKMHYAPGNIVVSAAGRVNHKELAALARRKFAGSKPAACPDYVKSTRTQDKPRINIYHKKTEQMHLVLGMHGCDENSEDRYAQILLNVILGGNMSSRLFVEVREKRGLAYSISSFMKTLHDTGMFGVRAGVDNAKITDALELVLKEIAKIRKKGVTDGEFKRARDYALGQVLLSLEDTMDHMLWIGESLIARNKVRTLADVVKAFNKLTPADIQRVAAKVLISARYNLAVVGPVNNRQAASLKALLEIKG